MPIPTGVNRATGRALRKEDQMNEPVKSGQGTNPAPAPSAALSTDTDVLRQLVALMLAEREEALLEKKEKLRALQAKNEQRRINAEYRVADDNRKQTICTHLKGAKGVKGFQTDYAVYAHTFTDGSSYIRCQICAAKWRNQDTVEYLVRGGQKIPNHTKIGWVEALGMLSKTTNTPSKSEMITENTVFAGPDVSQLS